ncbi:DoxX family protein [Streptomyces sp. NPDC055105]|uniref:DoxX family protein n=1 Tax=Streptomyces sp. NPDC055105 TaxID=3365719 RepID=UPI0037D81BD0
MFVAYAVVAILVSLLMTASGGLLIARTEDMKTTMAALDVPQTWFTPLALLKFAGALGLLAGIFYRPLGIAAGVGLALYFVGAVIAHLRVKDIKGMPVPVVLVVLTAAPVVLGIASV